MEISENTHKLIRIFYSIRTFETKESKLKTTNELIFQIKEDKEKYSTHRLLLLENIFFLVTSSVFLDRICGALILHSLPYFEYHSDFVFSSTPIASNCVYLSSSHIPGVDGSSEDDDYQNVLEDHNIDYNNVLQRDNIDYNNVLEGEIPEAIINKATSKGNKAKSKVDSVINRATQKETKTKAKENKAIESKETNVKVKENPPAEIKFKTVSDFYTAIYSLLLSPDWNKRHGGFLAFSAVTSTFNNSFNFSEDIAILNGSEIAVNSHCEETGTATFRRNNKESEIAHDDSHCDETGTALHTHADSHCNFIKKDKILLSGDIFNKIFEILKNDKFDDFEEDVTSSPVREAACLLLKYTFSMADSSKIFSEIRNLLISSDWQEKYSALLSLLQLKNEFIEKLKMKNEICLELFDLLVKCIEENNEDNQFLCAEILSHVFLIYRIDLKLIKKLIKVCSSEIDPDVGISHACGSILKMLSVLLWVDSVASAGIESIPSDQGKSSDHVDSTDLDIAPFLENIHHCFVSPISIVRENAFIFSIPYDCLNRPLAESILLETKNEYKQKGILCKKLAGKQKGILCKQKGNNSVELANHFIGIISRSVHLPYKESDFVCYDDTFFTLDGIKSIGPANNLNNRVALFSVLMEIEGIPKFTSGTILGETFQNCYLAYHKCATMYQSPAMDGIVTDGNEMGNGVITSTFGNGVINTLENNVINTSTLENNVINTITLENGVITREFDKNSVKSAVLSGIAGDFKKYPSLKKMPISEFKRIIEDFSYFSLFPMAYENCLELVRKYATEVIFRASDFTVYFQLENSVEFMALFCNLLMDSEKIEEISLKLINLIISMEKQLMKIKAEKPGKFGKRVAVKDQKRKSFKTNLKASKKISTKSLLYEKPQEDERDYSEIINYQVICNCEVFFKKLGLRLFKFKIFSDLLKNEDKLLFFKYTMKYFMNKRNVEDEMDKNISLDNEMEKNISLDNEMEKNVALDKKCILFNEAYKERNAIVLRELIVELEINLLFVNKMMREFDLCLYFALIDFSRPYFNCLFLDRVLSLINSTCKIINPCKCIGINSRCQFNPDISLLLSKMICYMHFLPTGELKDEKLIKLINSARENADKNIDKRLLCIYMREVSE